jgi:hypothetical protein
MWKYLIITYIFFKKENELVRGQVAFNLSLKKLLKYLNI